MGCCRDLGEMDLCWRSIGQALVFQDSVRLTAGMSSAYLLVNDVANVMEGNAGKIMEMGDFEE